MLLSSKTPREALLQGQGPSASAHGFLPLLGPVKAPRAFQQERGLYAVSLQFWLNMRVTKL